MRELDVVGVRVEMPSNAPMVLLREVGGTRFLPIWIGANEASAIANAQEGVVPPRPLTHDLMVDVLAGLQHKLTAVRITELEGGTFYAVLVIDDTEISARPSDAIALALRVGSDIFCAEDVLDVAGIEMPEAEEDHLTSPTRRAGAVSTRSRELRSVRHDDGVSVVRAPGRP
jgi:bifunctional DNase/RNase